MKLKFLKLSYLAIALPFFISCSKKVIPPVVENSRDLSLDSLQVINSNIPTAFYTDVAFINPLTGFAITEGLIVKTTDGGKSWTSILPPVNTGLTKIQFTDTRTGYIIGGTNFDPVLLKTTDGGEHWVRRAIPAPGSLNGLQFIDNNQGFITGQNLFIKTADGGLTWAAVKNGVSREYNDVEFKNPSEGTVTTSDGVYFTTKNGGTTWDSLKLADGSPLFDIYYTGSKVLAVKSSDTLIDLANHYAVTKKPAAVNKLLFTNVGKCIGIGSHYESQVGFWPLGDIFITNDGWANYKQKTYTQVDAIGFGAIAKMTEEKIMILGTGFSGTKVIILKR